MSAAATPPGEVTANTSSGERCPSNRMSAARCRGDSPLVLSFSIRTPASVLASVMRPSCAWCPMKKGPHAAGLPCDRSSLVPGVDVHVLGFPDEEHADDERHRRHHHGIPQAVVDVAG